MDRVTHPTHRNQQYSTVGTDSTGTATESYAYIAYGLPTITNSSGTVETSSAIENRYTYTGREWDGVQGLYHYRARMHETTIGRFWSRDPKGHADDTHRYTNYFSPNAIDPGGHKRELVGPETNVTDIGLTSVGALAFSPGLNPSMWSFAPASELPCCHRKTQYFGNECTFGW